MKNIDDIIERILNNPDCCLFPKKNNLPLLDEVDSIYYPEDMLKFYNLYGGGQLFEEGKANVSFCILPPEDIVRTNIIIVGESCDDDISSTWYTICKTDDGEYISIDLSKKRNGICYDSNNEIHGVVGSCPVIALSFTELITNIYISKGDDIFWKQKNYGDAYSFNVAT